MWSSVHTVSGCRRRHKYWVYMKRLEGLIIIIIITIIINSLPSAVILSHRMKVVVCWGTSQRRNPLGVFHKPKDQSPSLYIAWPYWHQVSDPGYCIAPGEDTRPERGIKHVTHGMFEKDSLWCFLWSDVPGWRRYQCHYLRWFACEGYRN